MPTHIGGRPPRHGEQSDELATGPRPDESSAPGGQPREDAGEPAVDCGSATWWLDVYFDRFGDQFLLASLTLGVVTYVAGLAIAWAIDFVPDYLKTAPLYVGLIGIVWTGMFVGWGRRRICQLLHEIESVFQPSAEQYVNSASRWLRRLLDWRPQLAMSVILAVASSGYVWYATGTGRFPWFPKSWSSPGPNLWVRNVLIDLFAIPVLVLLSSALVFIVVFTLFVLSVRKHQVMPVLPAALVLLRPLADFGFMLCLGWSVGVSLFIWFFKPSTTIGSVLVVTLLSAAAFTILFTPQYAIHSILLRTKRTILEAGALELAQDWRTDRSGIAIYAARLASVEGQELTKVVESVALSGTWVYNYGSLFPLVAPVGLPVAAFVLGQTLGA